MLRLMAQGDDANVAALFYNREQPLERYNMADTLKAQHIAHLTAGCVCYSDMGRILCSIIADTCGWHDPLCGLTDADLIAARYGATRFQEQRNARYVSGREGMLVELGKYGLGERDLVANINFFSKVVVDDGGAMQRVAGHARAGQYVDLRFEMDTLVLLHAGPHPLATDEPYAPRPIAPAGAPRCRPGCRRCVPHALPGKRARLHQHRTPVPGRGWRGMNAVPAPLIDAGRARRRTVDGHRAARPELPHRRSRRQPGRRHVVLQRHDTAEHYSAQNTIQAQRRIYLTTGSVLLSNRGRPMLRIEADTCGRHDTLGGACSAESNTVRYALEKRHMHSCRDSFLLALARHSGECQAGMTKRDLPSNINFFMNVPVTPAGELRFADGISAAGRYVELRALDGHAGADFQLPAAQQPLQCLQSDAIQVMVWAS